MTTSLPSMPGGMFMGDAMVPLPRRLAFKILNLEFIEINELLPENWPDLQTEYNLKFHAGEGLHQSGILDVGYASMVAVLSPPTRRLPNKELATTASRLATPKE